MMPLTYADHTVSSREHWHMLVCNAGGDESSGCHEAAMYEGQWVTSLEDACARPGKQGKARPEVVCNQGTDGQNSILCLQCISSLNELDKRDDTA